MRIRQINNLEIHKVVNTGRLSDKVPYIYQVRTLGKKILEEFTTYRNAIRCAKNIKDFVR